MSISVFDGGKGDVVPNIFVVAVDVDVDEYEDYDGNVVNYCYVEVLELTAFTYLSLIVLRFEILVF